MGTDTRDRNPLVAAVRAVLLQLVPNLRYLGDYEYSVAGQSGALVDLRPTDRTLGLPTLSRVPYRGAPGVAGELFDGTKVIVRFVNSDPGRPYVVAVEGADTSGFVPANLRVDADQTLDIGENSELVNVAGGAQFAALANLVKAEIDAFAAAYNGHTHTVSGGTAQATLATVAPGDVAASKVKVT